jgi:hypothetical protein
MMRRRIRVRFNLGKGKNYMKWRVLRTDGSVEFLDPNEVQLVMIGCTFKNSKRAAQRIFEGANKTVCAWILCDRLEVKRPLEYSDNEDVQAKYNPRVAPNWRIGEHDIDDRETESLHTVGSRIFITPLLAL